MNFGEETETIEFKETTSELHQAIESIASILNKHSNGELYFGVRDDGTVKGQMVKDSTLHAISDSISRDIEPRITPTIEKITLDGNECVKVSFSGMQKPYSAFGKFLIRVGTQNRIMTRDELRRLIKDEDYSYPWENEPNSMREEDVDETALKEYYKEAIDCGRLTMATYDKDALLSSLCLLNNGHFNNAAFALFGAKANIGLKLATFATDEKLTFIDLKALKGNIYNLYEIGVKYILDHINWRMEIGMKGETIPEIPVDAVREIVINAFAHAIYEPIPEIEINVHPSMVTVFNPGSFPDGLTPMDFVNKNIPSVKRNPIIVDVLYRCKNVEKSGTGFKRMNASCLSAGVKWDATLTAYGFLFTFHRNREKTFVVPNEEQNVVLLPNEKTIYLLIKEDRKITREELANKTGKTVRTIQRITNKLVASGYLIRIGSNRFGYWEVLK